MDNTSRSYVAYVDNNKERIKKLKDFVQMNKLILITQIIDLEELKKMSCEDIIKKIRVLIEKYISFFNTNY